MGTMKTLTQTKKKKTLTPIQYSTVTPVTKKPRQMKESELALTKKTMKKFSKLHFPYFYFCKMPNKKILFLYRKMKEKVLPLD